MPIQNKTKLLVIISLLLLVAVTLALTLTLRQLNSLEVQVTETSGQKSLVKETDKIDPASTSDKQEYAEYSIDFSNFRTPSVRGVEVMEGLDQKVMLVPLWQLTSPAGESGEYIAVKNSILTNLDSQTPFLEDSGDLEIYKVGPRDATLHPVNVLPMGVYERVRSLNWISEEILIVETVFGDGPVGGKYIYEMDIYGNTERVYSKSCVMDDCTEEGYMPE